MLQNQISEKIILASMIKNKKLRENFIFNVDINAFFNDYYKEVFSYILDLHINKSDIEVDVIVAKFGENERIEEIVLTNVATFKTMPIHIQNVNIAKYNRDLLATTKIIERDIKEGKKVDVQNAFADIKEPEEEMEYKDIKTIAENYELALENYDPNNKSTGIEKLDEMVYTAAGDLIILGARPSMGKTAFMLSVALNKLKMGYGAAIFSLEMPSEKIFVRSMSNVGQININEFKRGQFSDINKYKTAKDYLINHADNLKIIDEVSDIDLICKLIEHIYTTNPKIEDFFIDHGMFLTSKEVFTDQHKKIGAFTKKLKALAKRLGVKIWLLSQLNRGLENRPNKRPMMSDLRESGSIEEDADIVLTLYRQSYYDIRTQKEKNPSDLNIKEIYPNVMEIGVQKQRDGEVGVVEAMFNAPLMKVFDGNDRGPKIIENTFNENNISDMSTTSITECEFPDFELDNNIEIINNCGDDITNNKEVFTEDDIEFPNI